jgi:hypothetical protein
MSQAAHLGQRLGEGAQGLHALEELAGPLEELGAGLLGGAQAVAVELALEGGEIVRALGPREGDPQRPVVEHRLDLLVVDPAGPVPGGLEGRPAGVLAQDVAHVGEGAPDRLAQGHALLLRGGEAQVGALHVPDHVHDVPAQRPGHIEGVENLVGHRVQELGHAGQDPDVGALEHLGHVLVHLVVGHPPVVEEQHVGAAGLGPGLGLPREPLVGLVLLGVVLADEPQHLALGLLELVQPHQADGLQDGGHEGVGHGLEGAHLLADPRRDRVVQVVQHREGGVVAAVGLDGRLERLRL